MFQKLHINIKLLKTNIGLPISLKTGPCLVLGSAPSPVLPQNFGNDWNLITVNASQAVSEAMGLPKPDITVLSGQMLGNADVNTDAKSVIRDLETKLLLLIERGITYEKAEPIFNELNYRFDRHIQISHLQRAKIIKKITGKHLGINSGEEKVSTGLFAALLCLHLKSPRVVMAGFSLSRNGHAYSVSNHKRCHIDTDMAALRLIGARGLPVYTSDYLFSKESGIPLN